MDLNKNNIAKKDTAYQQIKKRIIDFSFAQGAIFTEDALASILDISRTPIRDAIIKLENEGLVDRLSKGVIIRRFTESDIIDTYTLREALEVCAIRLCVQRSTDEELISIRRDVEEYNNISVEKESYSEINDRFIVFHIRIVHASNNKSLIDVYDKMVDRLRIINRMHMNGSLSIEDVQNRHMNIIDAIIDRNEMLAVALLNASIRKVIRELM